MAKSIPFSCARWLAACLLLAALGCHAAPRVEFPAQPVPMPEGELPEAAAAATPQEVD